MPGIRNWDCYDRERIWENLSAYPSYRLTTLHFTHSIEEAKRLETMLLRLEG